MLKVDFNGLNSYFDETIPVEITKAEGKLGILWQITLNIFDFKRIKLELPMYLHDTLVNVPDILNQAVELFVPIAGDNRISIMPVIQKDLHTWINAAAGYPSFPRWREIR